MTGRDKAVGEWLTQSYWPPIEGTDPISRSIEELVAAKSHLRDIGSIPEIAPVAPTAPSGTFRHRRQRKRYESDSAAEAARSSALSGAEVSVAWAANRVQELVEALFAEIQFYRRLRDFEIEAREKVEVSLRWLQMEKAAAEADDHETKEGES